MLLLERDELVQVLLILAHIKIVPEYKIFPTHFNVHYNLNILH